MSILIRLILLVISLLCVVSFSHMLVGALRLNSAQLLQTRGRDAEATSALQKLVATRGGDLQVRWQAGHLLLRQQRLDEALGVLDPSLLASGNPDILNTQLTALLSDGQWQAAVALTASGALPAKRMHRNVAAGLAYSKLRGIADSSQLPDLRTLVSRALKQPLDSPNLDYLMRRVSSDTGVKQRLESTLLTLTNSWQLADPLFRESGVRKAAEPPIGKLPVSSVGEELLENGGFERLVPYFGIALPENWHERIQPHTDEWDRAIVASIVDLTHGAESKLSRMIRIDGIAVERDGGGHPALGGVQHAPIAVEVGQPYMLSFRYRTEDVSERGFSVWASGAADFFGERFLPPTEGEWRHAAFLFRSKAETLAPWVRLWTEGTVWVDEVSLRPIEVNENSALPDDVLVVPDVDAYNPR